MSLRSIAVVLMLALGAAGCASTAQRPADITQLSVVDAAQLIREKKVTSVELTQAYLARAEANRDLNAFITVDRAGALAAAQRADADLACRAQQGAAAWRAARREGQRARRRLPNSAGTPALKGSSRARRADGAGADRRRRRHPGQDQHARAGLRHLRLQRRLLHGPADRHAQSLRSHAHRRRQLQRHRRGHRRAAGAGRAGQRHRRLGPHPGRADGECRTASHHRLVTARRA